MKNFIVLLLGIAGIYYGIQYTKPYFNALTETDKILYEVGVSKSTITSKDRDEAFNALKNNCKFGIHEKTKYDFRCASGHIPLFFE